MILAKGIIININLHIHYPPQGGKFFAGVEKLFRKKSIFQLIAPVSPVDFVNLTKIDLKEFPG